MSIRGCGQKNEYNDVCGETYTCGYCRLSVLNSAKDKRIAKLERALESIMEELGVPGDGYPQPVANAYEIAKDVLGSRWPNHDRA